MNATDLINSVVKVEYFVCFGIVITIVLGVAGEFSIRNKQQNDKGQNCDDPK
jgi:hypothetical protein